MEKPKALYPTLKRGVIKGEIRLESLDGSELWLPPKDGVFSMKPFMKNGKMWCVSHLQKKATYFSLFYDPFIYHFGRFWHLQEQDMNGNWMPGTEEGIYTRTPGWRWQIPDSNSGGSPWIFTKGYFGFHLD